MHKKPVQVTAIVVFGSGVDKQTGLLVDDTSASRIKRGLQELLRARLKGCGVIILAPGKPPAGQVWRAQQTFAAIMAAEVRRQMPEIADQELIVNDDDDTVWTTWGEVDWAAFVAKRWYEKCYADQMVSFNDYTHLKLVFVSDRNHAAVRIPLMARRKLGYWFHPPYDDRFLPEQGMKHVVWATEPRWSVAVADHKPTPLWYETLATAKSLYLWARGK
jgi:hypothetical protein